MNVLPIHKIPRDDVPVVINKEFDKVSEDSIPFVRPAANIIESNNDSEANIFIFAAFADKRTGMLYSNLTGTFPFISLEGNVCFLIIHHFESNTILALPIANFDDEMILAACRH
jgi:hypothetical protein